MCVRCEGLPIYTGDINDHINHITAQLIGLHVHWRTVQNHMNTHTVTCGLPVSGNVDLADHVKQESFLNTRVLQTQTIEHNTSRGREGGLLISEY